MSEASHDFLENLAERLREVLGDKRYVVEVDGETILVGRRVLGDPAWSFARVCLGDLRSGGTLEFKVIGVMQGEVLDLWVPSSDPVKFVVSCVERYDDTYWRHKRGDV